jgi:hypothetical protein
MRAIRLVPAAGAVTVAIASGAVAARDQVTIEARPTVTRWLQSITLVGSVDTRRAEEIVTIQAKDCGQQTFREVESARTSEGGGWATQASILTTTTFRAVWDGRTSSQVTVRARPGVLLRRRSANLYDVRVQGSGGSSPFWRKRVLLQQLDRRLGSWRTVKRVVLTQSTENTTFRASVPKGSVVRAVLPLSQARPCYLAGYSSQVRT